MICVIQLASRIKTELQFRPDPARKLSANLYDIYHCCVCSEKLLMMDRRNVRNMYSRTTGHDITYNGHAAIIL